MKLPKGCKSYRDRTGVMRTYYRHTKPETALPGLPWSPEFMAAYEGAVAHAGRDKPLVIGASRTKRRAGEVLRKRRLRRNGTRCEVAEPGLPRKVAH